MTRDESFESILQPWMERNAPPTPQDLLPRVMREVDTVSQRTTTWPRLLFSTHPTAWVVATAAAAILAVSVGTFLLASGTRPVGADATPAPNDGASLTTAAEIIDASVTAFNAHDSVAAAHLFTQNATYRVALGKPSWDIIVDGLDSITEEFANHEPPDVLARHGSVLENGAFAATPVSWTFDLSVGPVASDYKGSGFQIWQLDGSRVQSWWILTSDGIPDTEPVAIGPGWAPANLVTELLAAWNTRDASSIGSLFTPTGQAHFAIGSADWTAVYQSPAAIASALSDVGIAPGTFTRTGAIIRYGRMLAFAATLSTGDETAKVFVVLRMSTDDSLIVDQWVFGG